MLHFLTIVARFGRRYAERLPLGGRRVAVFHAIVILFLLCGPIQAGLLANGSFETAGTAVSNAYAWESGNPDLHGDIWGSASRESWRAFSGTWESTVRGGWSGTNAGGWWQEVPAVSGFLYSASAWFWADNGAAGTWTALMDSGFSLYRVKSVLVIKVV